MIFGAEDCLLTTLKLTHLFVKMMQVTYSVPYALVASRIESLGLGQGGLTSHFTVLSYL